MNMHGSMTAPVQEWRRRPADQGFETLPALLQHVETQRCQSYEEVASVGTLHAHPAMEDPFGLLISGAHARDVGQPAIATHYSFGQMCGLMKAPAGYLRTLPGEFVADLLNYGIKSIRNDSVGLLVRQNGRSELAAATGPKYGRIWNNDVVRELISVVEDRFAPPAVGMGYVGKDRCTLFASQQDMFAFLIDWDHPIEVRTDRGMETLYRGIFLWNSEVGAMSLGVGTFLLRGLCFNKTIFGAQQYGEVRIRHSSGAPGRYLDEVVPAIRSYANGSAQGIIEAIDNARARRIGDNQDEVMEFLSKRYTKERAQALSMIHLNEEGRPIETLWDASNAVTALARGGSYVDASVELEREGGRLLALAS
jgi:hypothetical protein